MDLLSLEFLSALFSIVVIDLVLAGDNAIVIGMAARKLPAEQQGRVIFWGTAGAVIIRLIATFVVVLLLQIPGLLAVGGLLLIWIAFKLLVDNKEHDHLQAAPTMWEAIKTIIVADAAMGIDNVLAVAGAAHGSFLLVALGLIISVPVVVWGSTIFVKLVDRYPVLIYFGAGILVWTAAGMIAGEPILSDIFVNNPFLEWLFPILVVAVVLYLGYRQNKINA